MSYEKQVINVIFDPEKGSLSTLSREAECGQPFGTLPTPVRRGYRFEGWYLDGAPVTELTVVESDEDIRLCARWSRMKERTATSPSMYKRQKRAVAILSGVMAFLIVALLVVNYVVAIYGLTDVYYGEDGTRYTERYRVQKKDGVYALYDLKGNMMPTVTLNKLTYYVARSGNMYRVNEETGEYMLYAVVDHDASIGETVQSGSVAIFKNISMSNIHSIQVKNEYGSYRIYRDTTTDYLRVEGTEETITTYDAELLNKLCVACGYAITLQKLDMTSPESEVARLADGSVDWAAYGLADIYDEEGNLSYTPATYTITESVLDEEGKRISPSTANPDRVYTVKIGDLILSGEGYYVQLEGREAIYIVENSVTDFAETVLQPVEALIAPQVIYPSSTSAYVMVKDFIFGTVDMTGKWGNDEALKNAQVDIIAALTYRDMDERQGTLFSTAPYGILTNKDGDGFMEGYDINHDNVTEVLSLFQEMQYVGCKKLGITEEALKEFGLDQNVFYMSFASPMLDENNYIKGYMENIMVISQKTENNTYYIASFLTDMIVEVDQYYMSFLEWEKKNWYDQNFFGTDISYVKGVDIQIGQNKYNFILDNSETDQSNGIGSAKLKVFCEQYLGGTTNPHLLDYTLTYTYLTSAGKEKTRQISGTDNFRKLYTDLLFYTLEGDLDHREFEANMGMSVKDYIAANGDETCGADPQKGLQAIIRFRAEDFAATLNNYVYTDKNGNEVKLYTENNKMDVIMRLYRYSDRKAYLTIECVDKYDSNGQPITNPEWADGMFYVNVSYLNVIQESINRLLSNRPVEPENEDYWMAG